MDSSSRGHTAAMETTEYAPGRLVDVYGDPARPTVLLWHGMQTNARAAFGPLAGMLAGHGLAVVAPDWNSHADDGGRADLLGSLDFIRDRTDRFVLVGWSMGGAAAAGLTLDAAHYGVDVAHTVCLAGAFMVTEPISGRSVSDLPASTRVGAPFTLLHGVDDDAVPMGASREFAAALHRVGWPVEVVELDADHGSIAGADYDDAADRYVPGTSEQALRVAGEVADRIAATLRYE